MQDRSFSIANIFVKMPRNRILNELPAAVLIQERKVKSSTSEVKSSTSEVKCPNWMMEKSVIAF